MRFRATSIQGVFIVGIEPNTDVRGFFARTWCAREFAEHGLPSGIVQTSVSHNERRGTVRGMHLQLPPSAEAKLVSCLRGAIYDVVIDLRPSSATFMRHLAVELTADTQDALYMPPLTAHGFQTLADGTRVLYQMTDYFRADLGFGLRWNDPGFGIRWPITEEVVILPRDRDYPDFDRAAYERRLHAGPSRDAVS